MGKIFKALEKAEKESGIKPAPQSLDKSARSKMETIEILAKNRPVVRYDDQTRTPDHVRQDMDLSKFSTESKAPARSDYHATEFWSPTEPETMEPFIQSNPFQRSEQQILQSNIRSEMKAKETPVQSRPVHEPPVTQQNDSLNIVLVKPESSESQNPVQRLKKPTAEEFYDKTDHTDGTTSRNRVNVHYSRTKVQINDPKKLRNNKVLSVFEDMETTNEFKILRTKVLKKLKQIGGNSILVTSANPYEGKTFTSINLGVSIAKEFDRTVLIIDADIRRQPQDHTDFSTEFFSLRVEKGLTDYLEGNTDIEDILINPGIDKLTLIPGGLPVDNSSELLNSARMEEMMLEIKSRYPSDRLVIVDGPAFLHFPDAMILSRYVDGVLPVIESERTPTDDVKKMMTQLQEVNILGVVLNKNKGHQ